jgi:TRAP-type uncharacterized transport system fused permease subunit
MTQPGVAGAREDPRPPLAPLVMALGVVLSLAHIWFNTFATLPELWVSALHFGGLGCMAVLLYPTWSGAGRASRAAALTLDVLLGLLALVCAVYLILYEQALYDRGQTFSTADWVVSTIAVLLAVELTRRTRTSTCGRSSCTAWRAGCSSGYPATCWAASPNR